MTLKILGEFKDGDPNQGTTTYPDGEKYVGDFKNDKPNGQGTYTWKNGDEYVGEWKNGKRWNGIHYDKNRIIKYKIVNEKCIE